jgi:hypothetical protein
MARRRKDQETHPQPQRRPELSSAAGLFMIVETKTIVEFSDHCSGYMRGREDQGWKVVHDTVGLCQPRRRTRAWRSSEASVGRRWVCSRSVGGGRQKIESAVHSEIFHAWQVRCLLQPKHRCYAVLHAACMQSRDDRTSPETSCKRSVSYSTWPRQKARCVAPVGPLCEEQRQ